MSGARLHIVLNAGAGHQSGSDLQEAIEAALAGSGREHEIHVAETPDRLREVAAGAVEGATASGGIVVAAGGDGTINTVAAAALRRGCPLGVVAAGTFNYFARTHGLPLETAEAVRALLAGQPRPVPVGLVNEQVFLVNASLGLYPELLEDREAWKRRFGRSQPVALVAALATFARSHRSLRLEIDVDGNAPRKVRASTVFIGNNRLQLEQIGIGEAEAVDAGRLVVLTLKPARLWAMLKLMVRGAMGSLGDADEVITVATAALTIAPARRFASRRIKVATDGEVHWLQAPLVIRRSPEPLMLVMPDAVEAAA